MNDTGMATAMMIPKQRRQHKMAVRVQIERNAKVEDHAQQRNRIPFVKCGLENGKQLQLWDSNLHKNTVWSVFFAVGFWPNSKVSGLDLDVYGVFC